jgi:CRP-like cAMP-binding protein
MGAPLSAAYHAPLEVLPMLTDTEMLTTLRQHPLLAGLTDGLFQEVCRQAIQRRLETGECLVHQGESADRFYVLIQGQIKLTRVLMEGQEKLVEIVQPGQSFGEALMFAGQSLTPFSASALKPCLLASLDGAHFRRLLEGQPQLCLKLLGRFSQRMHQFLEEIDTLAMANASQRVARYLNQELQEGANLVQLHVPKRLIASQLGIQPETFSRILHRLMDAGIIAMERRNIRVLDTPALTGFIQ